MRVLVCGGRDYTNRAQVNTVLDYYLEQGITCVIHGGARGADKLAGEWAKDNHIPQEVFYADWDTYPKAAGPIRNQQMLNEGKPDLVIAFPGGKGTADMIRKANKAGVEVVQVVQVY